MKPEFLKGGSPVVLHRSVRNLEPLPDRPAHKALDREAADSFFPLRKTLEKLHLFPDIAADAFTPQTVIF